MDLDYPKIRRAILTASQPMTRLIGKIEIPSEPILTKTDLWHFTNAELPPGTVLLSRKRLQLSNVFIPGEWKHASMFCGYGTGTVEAVDPKTRLITNVDWFSHQDYITALIPTFCGQHIMKHAAEIAMSLVGTDYDLAFEYGDGIPAFYCAEIIWYAYDQALKKVGLPSPFTPRITMGVPTITPDDFWLAKDKWREAGFTRARKAA